MRLHGDAPQICLGIEGWPRGPGESQVGTQGLNKHVILMEGSRMFPPTFSQKPTVEI